MRFVIECGAAWNSATVLLDDVLFMIMLGIVSTGMGGARSTRAPGHRCDGLVESMQLLDNSFLPFASASDITLRGRI